MSKERMHGEESSQTLSQNEGFSNLQDFMGKVVCPIRTYGEGEEFDPSDKTAYFPPVSGRGLRALDSWREGFERLGAYAGTDKTLNEIGEDKGVSGEAVRTSNYRTARNLYSSADPETREEFPFESLSFTKPLPISLRKRISEKSDGPSAKIASRIEEGATLSEIKESFTTDQIGSARSILEGWGIELDREYVPFWDRFHGLKRDDLPDSEIQIILDEIKNPSPIERLKQEELICGITEISRESGLHFKNTYVHEITAVLQKEGLPVKLVPLIVKDRLEGYYHIIATVHRARAIEILKNSESLDRFRRNPVTRIAGSELPDTNQLLNSGDYARIGKIISEITGKKWTGRIKNGIAIEDIISASPISIYRYRGGFFYQLENEETLREFLDSRMRELGII